MRLDAATQPVTNLRSEDDAFAELVVRARAGDPDAFRRLAGSVHGRIHRWALGRTGSPDDADDVAQTVLVRLHGKLGAYLGGRFTAWLYRMTASVAEEIRRKRQRRIRLLEDHFAHQGDAFAAEPALEGSIDAARIARIVLERFRELPDRQREVFDLVDLQGHTPAEVAELLGLEPVTVRTNLLRARRAIRRKILECHPRLLEEYRS